MFATENTTHPETASALHTNELNPEQRAAVEHRGSHLLIVAGAGTGKTKTLAARVCDLIEQGADPNRILLLTFTRRASAEMISRVATASSSRAASQVWGGTFHSVANRLLRQFGAAAGLPANFTVLDQGDSTDLFGMIRNDEALGERGKRFPRKETIAGIYGRMVSSQAKLTQVLETDFPWCADHIDELKDIFAGYTAKKRAHHVLDYDDLLLFWRGLTASPVGASMRDLFDHILVDEYQDTNPIQSDIIRGMTRDSSSATPTQVCAVGDDAQAIYGFRSATVENMWAFDQQFPGAKVITLEQNYRSTMPILAAANAVLNQPIPAGSAGTVTATTQPDNHLDTTHFHKELWSTRITGPMPALVTAADEADQSRYVVDEILAARERGIDLRDQAVLFRAGHHGDGLELELTRRDVPYVKYGGLKYLEAAHVKDLLALLRILDNPADELAWHRVLSGIDGVGPATLRRATAELGLGSPQENRDQDGATIESGSGRNSGAPDGSARNDSAPNDGVLNDGVLNDNALNRFLNGEARLPNHAAPQVDELRAALEDCSGDSLSPTQQVDRLRPFCALLFPAKYENPVPRLADIEQLATTAANYGSRSRFLAELTLDPPSKSSDRAGPPSLDDDWLTLSTIHSAKGMEWRAVHVLHAADGSMPSDMATGDAAGVAEELRLFYVAMTRAKDELTVTFPLRYHVHRFAADDRHIYAQMSRFVEPVRELFNEKSTTELRTSEDRVIDISNVGVSDEVDTMLHALWD